MVISEKLKALGEVKMEVHGGPRSVAEILNRMDSALSDDILTNMQDEQPLVDAIRHYMFTFDDLLLIDAMAMKEVVAQDRPQAAGGGAQRHQRSVEKSFPAMHVATAAPKCCAKTWKPPGPVRIRDVEGSPAADPGRGAAVGERRRAEPEGRRRRSVCRLRFCPSERASAAPVFWRRLRRYRSAAKTKPADTARRTPRAVDQARREAYAEGIAGRTPASRGAGSSRRSKTGADAPVCWRACARTFASKPLRNWCVWRSPSPRASFIAKWPSIRMRSRAW